MTANFERLKEYVIEHSHAQDWAKARDEWTLQRIYQEDLGTCVCGQYPITDHCVLKNEKNGETMIVGNQCVKHFDNELSKSCSAAHASLKKLRKDPTARAHPVLIELCRKQLTDRGADMYLDKRLKRNLSGKQEKWIIDMNRKILAAS